jgi:hypothetical protein
MAVVGDPATVGPGVADRWGTWCDRVALYVTYDIDPATLLATVEALRAA